MSEQFNVDPELQDALERDPELMRLARMLSSAKSPEPPLDDAFRANLRRQLMDQAWDSVEDKRAWWRGLVAPQRLAWASAAAVVVIAASVVYYVSLPGGASITESFPHASSTLANKQDVAAIQAIPVKFDQPMDHPSTQAAVQITPATAVSYSWSGDTVMYVTPTSGNLAPNTQYQVTIGPGAKTQAGVTNKQPQSFTFVTTSEPAAAPSPSPSPTPSAPTGLLTAVHQLTTAYPPAGTVYPVVWSADSSTVYFAGANCALQSLSLNEGTAKTLVADGASAPAISRDGLQLAYVRNHKIEILELAAGQTTEVAADATTLVWVRGQLYWGSAAGVFRLAADGPQKVADLPDQSGALLSIAPDGRHFVTQTADGLSLVDAASDKAISLCAGGCANSFQGWSPDGSRVVFGGTIADMKGNAVSSLPDGQEISWSSAGEVLLGSDTGVFEVRPDGSDYAKLADGTYRDPVWAPDATTFTFVRGSSLWVATAPKPTPAPPAIQQALAVVKSFMKARVSGETEHATSYLDANGKTAYGGTAPVLIPQGDPGLKRFYILMGEVDPSTKNVRVVVRLVFAHGNVEQLLKEETLTLVRAQASDPYLIDGATAGPQLQFGQGPTVVSVKVSAASVAVTFDSDLIQTSVSNVTLQNDQGVQVTGTVAYDDRTVTISGLQLTPGAHYRLVVLPGVQDVGQHNAAAEYDLDLIGPAAQPVAGGVSPSPSPSASPSPSPSPAVTPS